MLAQSKYMRLERLFPKTLIPQFRKIFGDDATEKLLTVFSGTTIRVPSVRDQENAFRDIAIFETLENSKDASESRRLGEALSSQHGISRRKVRAIYRSMRKLFKLNKALTESDIATGQHKIKKVKSRAKSKLRGM